MSDLALDQNGDLLDDNAGGDFSLVSGRDEVTQTLKVGLQTSPGSMLFAPWEGILIPRESVVDETGIATIKRRYETFLESQPAIKADSVQVEVVTGDDGISYSASFETVDSEKIEGFAL